MALNLYNVNRFTADMDIMIDFERGNVLRFSKAMKKLAYVPRVPVKIEDLADRKKREMWQKKKHAVVFTLNSLSHPFPNIDVFLSHPIDFRRAYRSRRILKGGKFNVSLVSPENLMKLKEIAGREKDLADIKHLRQEMEL